MRPTELLLIGLAGWTAIGVLGIAVARARGERDKVRRGIAWLAGAWIVYMSVLIGVSLGQRQRVMAMGEQRCFGEMCFAVTRAEDLPGFLIRDGRRLVRVSIRITNRGPQAQSEELIRAYLMDAQGRRWEESAGVNGVGLTTRVAGGDSVVSEPVFKVAGDATGLALVLTRGWRQRGLLTIGDSDSLLHRRTIVNLAH
jgi:hypothetical protein